MLKINDIVANNVTTGTGTGLLSEYIGGEKKSKKTLCISIAGSIKDFRIQFDLESLSYHIINNDINSEFILNNINDIHIAYYIKEYNTEWSIEYETPNDTIYLYIKNVSKKVLYVEMEAHMKGTGVEPEYDRNVKIEYKGEIILNDEIFK